MSMRLVNWVIEAPGQEHNRFWSHYLVECHRTLRALEDLERCR